MPYTVTVVRNLPLLRFRFVEAHARDLGVGEGRPRDHPVVRLEGAEAAEQRVDRRVPRLVRRRVRELERPGDVAARGDVGIDRLQGLVGLDGALRRGADAEFLQPVARGVRDPPDRDEDLVELDRHLGARVLADQAPRAVAFDAQRLVPEADVDALGAKRSAAPASLTSGSSRSISRGAISTCVTWLPSRAKACASSQPIGPPPSTSSRRGSVADVPERVRRQVADAVEAGNRRHQGPRAGRDHDALRRQRARPLRRLHLDGPRRRDPRGAFDARRRRARV